MIYAYVSSETCVIRRAYLPGTASRSGKPVSRDGDLNAWTHGKRATLDMLWLSGAHNSYQRQAARLVAELRGWL